MRSVPRASATLLAPAFLVLVVLAGCSTGASPSADGLAVTNAWIRPPAGGDRPAAGYLTISNRGPDADALVGVTTSVAQRVELHRTTTMSGMTGMEPVESIHIPAGGTVTLEPGGFHLMLMDVSELTVGDVAELELRFDSTTVIIVTAEVRNG